jgi:hypothetical protein
VTGVARAKDLVTFEALAVRDVTEGTVIAVPRPS